MKKIIQCVPNFSEGRNTKTIESIVKAAKEASSAIIADYSWDVNHNRMVLTLLGDSNEIYFSIKEAVKMATELIDLRNHKGAHPRIGAVDVIPLAPIQNTIMQECIDLSYRIGDFIAQLGVPIFYYEQSALNDEHRYLPDIRKGGFESMQNILLEGSRKPDAGPNHIHPSAGASVIGARNPLVAYNINLVSKDINMAKNIVREIRSNKNLLPGLKAISVDLVSIQQVQVSMNVTKPDLLSLSNIYRFVEQQAHLQNVDIAESEIIGCMSKKYLGDMTLDDIKAKNVKPTQFLEEWI